MAPPRKHDTDTILDAARDLVLADGPRAASVAVIATASGAPVGTLYHRFGSRDGILAAVWLRAVRRFQEQALAARDAATMKRTKAAHTAASVRFVVTDRNEAVEAGVAMAVASFTFAARHPAELRLLIMVRRRDLLDEVPAGFQAELDAINAPLQESVAEIARALHGRVNARHVDVVVRAVVDLPTAALRRHMTDIDRPLPRWLEHDVADAAGVLLRSPPP